MDLLVVGLDGLSENMLRTFDVEADFLRSVQSSGVSGDLRSVDTPTTLPAWTSFATGKDPGSHGISNMIQQSADYETSPARPNTTDAAVYDLVDDAAFINLPGTLGRVPAGADVWLVSSFLSTDKFEAVPDELHDLEAFEEYRIHDDSSLKSDPETYVQDLCDVTRARYRFARETFERYEPRIGFVLFSTPDWMGHYLSFAADQETQREWYRDVVELIDDCGEQLSQAADNVVLLSDHGFELKPNAIHLQTWLRNEGYLRDRSEHTAIQRLATSTATFVAKYFDSLYDVIRNIYFRVIHTTGGEHLDNVVNLNPDVDFRNSAAWQLRYGCIYINGDRFEQPTVDDPNALRKELRERLTALTDRDGNRVFQAVLFPEDAYNDPDPDRRLPDVIARPAPGYLPLRAWSPTDECVIPKPGNDHYDHRYRGLFAADGPAFDADASVEDMSIVDVVPTLLHALDAPLASDFDGDARTDILATSADPRVLDAAAVPTPEVAEESAGGELDEEVVERRLEDLGYLE